ncbi:hypothetical protein EAX61_10920 [Dokdonia sinensis]|uniref:MmcQ/YjbR family DNA-binding protein n=1 Tax=Dokdonia sinensis TaxID=2479847 RepID=A0A3M0FYQ6_9FLAO|nr:hypothetical protein [Dokdonia sinensis]RMB57618.1 hypothetical protein EAX61_10920 [Dokdonia sinensis]
MTSYDFIIDLLYPLELRQRKMFGVDAYYIEDKMVFALREKNHNIIDNGIWIATTKQHHQKLKHTFKTIKPIETIGIKSWLMLPASSDIFEYEVQLLVHLIRMRSPLIGIIPKSQISKK